MGSSPFGEGHYGQLAAENVTVELHGFSRVAVEAQIWVQTGSHGDSPLSMAPKDTSRFVAIGQSSSVGRNSRS